MAYARRGPSGVFVDDLTHPITWYWPTTTYWGQYTKDARLSVIDVDPKRPGVHVWVKQKLPADEDPGLDNTLITLRDGALVVTSLSASAYNAGGLTVTPSGELMMRISHCPPHKAFYAEQGGRLVKTREDKGKVPEHGCAACPFVDVLADAQLVTQGEVLRYHVGAEHDGWQRLRIDPSPALRPDGDRVVTVRLRESKPEDTWLDAVALRVNGERVWPDACAGDGTLCARDHGYRVLAPGDEVVLRFTLKVPPAGPVFVEAAGYYLPRADAP